MTTDNMCTNQCLPIGNGNACNKARTRNAFMHFLSMYREHQQCKQPACQVAKDAAELWNGMSLNDKCIFIEAARNACYTYRARDRRMNRVLTHLRKSLKCEQKVNVIQLARAVKQLQLWKRALIKELLGRQR